MTDTDILGYQLVNADSETPAEFTSFEILSREVVESWQREHADAVNYQVLPIHEGDIEEPSFVD